MYIGNYEVRLRAKNRLAFPSKFRKLTGDTLYITNWFEDSLIILSKKEWEKLTTDLLSVNSYLIPDVRDLERFIFGGSFEVNLDIEGRFVLPEYLKNYAKIDKEAVFIGGMWYISLWDLNKYESYRDMSRIQIKDKALRAYEKLKNHE